MNALHLRASLLPQKHLGVKQSCFVVGTRGSQALVKGRRGVGLSQLGKGSRGEKDRDGQGMKSH